MRPRKPTYDDRILLPQEARVVLEPEPDAPAGGWRRVQILIPQSPGVFFAIDKKPQRMGLDRNYKIPPYPPGQAIVLHLLPEQYVMGMSEQGYALCTIIVEHFGGE